MYKITIAHSQQRLNKIMMLIFALSPLLAWYKIAFPVSLGYTLILFLSAYTIYKNKQHINVLPRCFWLLFIYISFLWIVNNDFHVWTLFPPGGWLFFLFVLAIIGGTLSFNYSLLKKYMRWIVLCSIPLFWIQQIFLLSTGSIQICFVPPLTNEFTYMGFTYGNLVSKQLSDGQACAFFLEKSYMAYYLITYLALEWFDKNGKEKWLTKEIVLIILTLAFLRSGSGIVGFSILFTIKIFSIFWNTNLQRRILMIILLIPLLGGTLYVYINTEIGQKLLSRSEEFSTEGSSGYSRVIAGYLLFDQLNTDEKVIGIPDARERFSLQRADGTEVFYINGIQTILINLGIIGFVLYILFYGTLYKNGSFASRMCIIVLLTMSLLESNYLNPYMMLLTFIPCADLRNRRQLVISNK